MNHLDKAYQEHLDGISGVNEGLEPKHPYDGLTPEDFGAPSPEDFELSTWIKDAILTIIVGTVTIITLEIIIWATS
jgi:hypothetical protein